MKKTFFPLFLIVVSAVTSYIVAYFFLNQWLPLLAHPMTCSSVLDLQNTVRSIAQKASPAVVSIIVSKDVTIYRTDPFGFFFEPTGTIRRNVGGGSWFFFGKNGLILTNKHVVEDPNAEYTIITSDGKQYKGKIISLDPLSDIAVIRALDDKGFPIAPPTFLEMTDSLPPVGSFVIAIGNALAAFNNTLTFGVVSGLNRSINANDSSGESEYLRWLIQTDAAINPGNSGGPLMDMTGKVIGINTAVAAGANGLGFAIPLIDKDGVFIRESIDRFGEIHRPFIGIHTTVLWPEELRTYALSDSYGVLIAGNDQNPAITKDSPAEKAGLEAGDIILQVNGSALSPSFSLGDALRGKFPGDFLTMTLWRSNTKKKKVVSIVLGEIR